jgi:RNA polymerase sigma-70 factor (ECF subfamily)
VVVNSSREAVEMTGSEAVEARSGPNAAAAFQALADQHLDAAYRLARVILRDETEAQDATHDAFVQAWRKWSTLRDTDRFEAWFDRILVNACKDRLRRGSRTVARDISDELGLETPDPYLRTHERDAIDQALATLSPDQRVVVALRYDRDLAADEIARRLDIPVGTVHSRLHYALRKLHEVIAGFELEGTAR